MKCRIFGMIVFQIDNDGMNEDKDICVLKSISGDVFDIKSELIDAIKRSLKIKVVGYGEYEITLPIIDNDNDYIVVYISKTSDKNTTTYVVSDDCYISNKINLSDRNKNERLLTIAKRYQLAIMENGVLWLSSAMLSVNNYT